jgi:hypothetical protein
MNIYISPDFFNYYSYPEYTDYNDEENFKRPFEILKHAEDLLNINPDGEYVSDAIININRAITLRLKDIKKKFNFSNIPFINNKDLWSRLEELGLIRKHLINEINNIRNQIEHEDKGIPDVKLCRLYIEFTWYFLKSTNLLCIRKLEQINFEIDDYYWVNCKIDFANKWETTIFGWFDNSKYSFEYRDGFILVDATRIEKRIDIVKKEDDTPPYNTGRGKNDDDLIINGKMEFDEMQFRKIYLYIFSIYQDT